MLNVIFKETTCLTSSAIADFNVRVVINLDKLTPLAGDTTIANNIIASRVKSLEEVSSRDLGLIISCCFRYASLIY